MHCTFYTLRKSDKRIALTAFSADGLLGEYGDVAELILDLYDARLLGVI